MTIKNVVILGANSEIAYQVAKIYAAQKMRFVLVSRSRKRLEAISKELLLLGAEAVTLHEYDLVIQESFQELHDRVFEAITHIDLLLLAHGTLPSQQECQDNLSLARAALDINFTSPVLLLSLFAISMVKAKQGHIAVISSVAGDLGRASNYVYGSAKGGLSIFCAGLHNRLAASGVNVLTIKPGMISTPMTAHLEKHILFASSARTAREITQAIEKRRRVLYTPGFWKIIMFLLKLMPNAVMKRLSNL